MTLKIRNKIRLGFFVLLALTITVGSLSVASFWDLKKSLASTVFDNYRTLKYCQELLRLSSVTNQADGVKQPDFKTLRTVLDAQLRNVTEPGEQEASTRALLLLEAMQRQRATNELLDSFRLAVSAIERINLEAIERKNNEYEVEASNSISIITSTASLTLLLALVFAISFPAQITKPIIELEEAVKEIGLAHYTYRIEAGHNDEFASLARSFNEMAEKLNGYQNSNIEKILAEKNRAESVISSLQDPSFGVDTAGIVLFATDSLLEMAGLQNSEFIGQQLQRVASRNDLIGSLISQEQNAVFKVVENGSEHFYVRTKVSIDRDNTSIGWLYSLSDVTEFEDRDKRKTKFIATIAHELKTPLSSIDLGLRLLMDGRTGRLSNEQSLIVGDLQHDNKRLTRIVAELLDLSQADSGEIRLAISSISAPSLVEYAQEALRNQAGEKNIVIHSRFDDDIPQLRADSEKAVWVLVNVLSNAIRYSHHGQEVEINATHHSGSVQIAVIDHGAGIPIEYQTKIFERYFRVPSAHESLKGSGLGLAIAREFMEAMNGQLYYEPNPEGGSRFVLVFEAVHSV